MLFVQITSENCYRVSSNFIKYFAFIKEEVKDMAKHFLKKYMYYKVGGNNSVTSENVKKISFKNLCLGIKALRFFLKLLKGIISHLEIARLSALFFTQPF